MVWIETPTNPLLKIVDIQGAAETVHQHEVSCQKMQYFTIIKLITTI